MYRDYSPRAARTTTFTCATCAPLHVRSTIGERGLFLGVIDDKFLARQPGWPQRLGERIQVRRTDVDSFVDALERFTAAVL